MPNNSTSTTFFWNGQPTRELVRRLAAWYRANVYRLPESDQRHTRILAYVDRFDVSSTFWTYVEYA